MINRDFLLGYGAGKAAGGGGGGGGGSSSLPAGFSGVAFIDYDGTVLHTYTPEEFSALSDLPANPTHEGLTAQGWNWTKAQITAQLTAAPGDPVIVGQMYITDDGKTRVYISLEEGRLSPYLGLAINGSVDIDWGDGSTHDTATGTSATTVVNTQHSYAAAGDYVITLTVTGSAAIIGASSPGSRLLWKGDATTAHNNRVYQNAIRRVEIGKNVTLGDYAFYHCYSLTSITIPSGVTSIGTYAFSSCYSLTSITIPSEVTFIGTYAFSTCYSITSITIPSGVTIIGRNAINTCTSLTSVTLPSGATDIGMSEFSNDHSLTSVTIPSRMTSIGDSMFSSCRSLASITIPSGVTSIGSSAFSDCYGLGFIRFKGTTPPTSTSSTWSHLPTDCIIYVPSSADHSVLDAYKTKANYPNPTTYTYMEE